jgi:uncharacterized protein (TIGR03435 family)
MMRTSSGTNVLRKKLFIVAAELFVASLFVLFLLAIVPPSDARPQNQNSSAFGPDFKYDVVSIKPNKSSGIALHTNLNNLETPDGFTATSVTMQTLIRQAYGVGLGYAFDDGKVSGASAWLDSETFDVQAKMDATIADQLQKLSQDQRRLARQQMLQALLADRIKLAIHRETKDLPVYWPVVAKNGPRLQESKPSDTTSSNVRNSVGEGERTGGGPVPFHAAAMSALERFLSGRLRRPVLDKTGLIGTYDFTLQWSRDDGQQDPNGPSLFTAVQEQLGLKLESEKAPANIIVIDHVERPSGN